MVHRIGARAVLLTPENRVLLMEIVHPDDGHRFWITPGGGLEPGESKAEGLLREMKEELGTNEFELGPSFGHV